MTMLVGKDRYDTDFFERHRYWVWGLVGLYVWALPSAILLFNWLIDQLSLAVARWVPVLIIAVLVLALLIHPGHRGRRYQWKAFMLPLGFLCALVVVVQSNPIKYIHIPEYALLFVLVWLALGKQRYSFAALVSAMVCATMLGFTDELHQGAHPERYYGWKDMLINAIGCISGLLWVNTYCRQGSGPEIDMAGWTIALNSALLLVLGISLWRMLLVQSDGSYISYSSTLFVLNIVCFIAAVALASIVRARLVSAPALILALNHFIILVLVGYDITFR